jgi:transposase-like protein
MAFQGLTVSVAAMIAMAVNTDGRREIIGLGIGPSEAETFWTEFLRGLKGRGLEGVKLVISDAHTGLISLKKGIGPGEAGVSRCWPRRRIAPVRPALGL